jgi:hypothetical protein
MEDIKQNPLRKKWNKADIDNIIVLRKKGFTFKAIANFFFVTANAVRKALQRHHISYINITKDFQNIINKSFNIDNQNNNKLSLREMIFVLKDHDITCNKLREIYMKQQQNYK